MIKTNISDNVSQTGVLVRREVLAGGAGRHGAGPVQRQRTGRCILYSGKGMLNQLYVKLTRLFFSMLKSGGPSRLKSLGRGSNTGTWFSRTVPGATSRTPTPSTPSDWRSTRCLRRTGNWTRTVLFLSRTTSTGTWSGSRHVWSNKR